MRALRVRSSFPLAPLTTLELGGSARYLIDAHDEHTVCEAVAWARREGVDVVPLGGGSNVVVSDEGVDALVVRVLLRGIREEPEGNRVLVTAMAGEPWDALVERTVAAGLAGLECLSGIPGLVGATPIQNVGAYGQEVAETICSLRVLDVAERRVRTLSDPARECGFSYRTSWFRAHPGRCIILSVTFALKGGGSPTLRYPELAETLAPLGRPPSLSEVRGAVLGLRRRKSMVIDPADENRRSVGSFFTNPVLSTHLAAEVEERARQIGVLGDGERMPTFPAGDGMLKIPAAWLLERAGVRKGMRRGQVGVSSRHALALVHHGGGSSAALIDLARELRDAVRDRFGVILTPEPVLLGFGAPPLP